MAGLIAFGDLARSQPLLATFERIGVGTEQTPRENMMTRPLGQVWRVTDSSAGGASTVGVRLRLLGQPRLQVIALLGFSVAESSPSKVFRVQVFGQNLSGVATVLADLNVTAGAWRGINGSPPCIIAALPQEVARVTHIEVTWLSDMSAPTYSIGRFWASRALVIPDGMDASWSMTWASSGTTQRSRGGAIYAMAAPRWREVAFTCTGIPRSLVFPTIVAGVETISVRRLATEVGDTGEVLAVLRSNTDVDAQETSVYGSFPGGVKCSHAAGDYFDMALNIAEER